MTAKAALCKALLEGRTLNVKNCFETIGLTNCAREVSRMVEKDFKVTATRKRREGFSKYGQPVQWVDYSLPRIDENKEGIEKMQKYIKDKLK